MAAPFPKEAGPDGSFRRQASAFRRQVTRDGGPFPAASGRYHLYVSYACPWAHRTLVARALLGLEDAIGIGVVDPWRDEKGWAFREGDGHGKDEIEGFRYLSEAYRRTDPDFDARVTVPVLWDTQTKQIVNNESADLLRMLDDAFRPWQERPLELAPTDLRDQIDALNAEIYDHVNNGVYRCGFATTQDAYDAAFWPLFDTLDRLDRRLADRRWLLGDRFTETDIRLFTTVLRFDPVYYVHFKCNWRRIADYPHLSGWLRDVYQLDGVADTVRMDHIKRHYYTTHRTINPTGIVPLGPELDLDRPPGRDHLGPSPFARR